MNDAAPQSEAATGPRGAAFIFIFTTVVLDMLSLGMIIPVLPKLIWYGASGDFSEAVIATIEPNIRRDLRTMFPDWSQSKNPDEVVEPGPDDPVEKNGILVAEEAYEGTIDNGGVNISAEDGFLSRVSDAGRSIADLRGRIKSGEIDPTKG